MSEFRQRVSDGFLNIRLSRTPGYTEVDELGEVEDMASEIQIDLVEGEGLDV